MKRFGTLPDATARGNSSGVLQAVIRAAPMIGKASSTGRSRRQVRTCIAVVPRPKPWKPGNQRYQIWLYEVRPTGLGRKERRRRGRHRAWKLKLLGEAERAKAERLAAELAQTYQCPWLAKGPNDPRGPGLRKECLWITG